MALRKITKSFAPSNRQINYLSKTFPQYRQNLMDFAKVYFPQTYTDFSEASPGAMFIEMAAYVGDVLGYYIDTNFRENLLGYAQEQDNVISLAQSLGYKPKPGAAAQCDIDVYQLCPATDITQNYVPDERFYIRTSPSAVFSSPDFPNVNFRTITEINFSDPTDREITVYATDINNKPLTYLIKKTVSAVAGTIKTYTATFGSPQKFAVISIPDINVMDVISVIDGNGTKWYEVDFLTQDLIFQDIINIKANDDPSFSVPPTYTIQINRVAERFVTRYASDFSLELHFGSGIIDDSDPSINFDPNMLANTEYQTNLGSTSLDPSDFLSSRSYGLAPSNIDMIITYAVGGGLESNVPSNSITKVVTVTPLNDTTAFTPAELSLWNDVVQSIAVNNPNPATGGKDADTIDEIRESALGFFNAQNRLVTAEDYISRAYAMPAKYGGPAKVFVLQDDQINNILKAQQNQAPANGIFVTDNPGSGIINLYVLGYNQQKDLVTLNMTSKQNLSTYLDQYRMMTDQVRILDAFVINIGVQFKVVVYPNYNMNDVLTRCIDSINTFFNIDNWQINQPIILNDLNLQIGSVDGVQSVLNVEIFNRYQFTDGLDYSPFVYDIVSATSNGIVYPSLDASIFELRYPETDIVGSAVQ